MDLSALGSTLPPGLADVERDMGDKFRAAALNITTFYKSALSSTKQAYHSGYSDCLSDVLSTVQSSIASGQDASQALSSLMDWAEARETAMAAFAAEETDEPSAAGPSSATASVPRRATAAKRAVQSLNIQRHSTSNVPDPTRSAAGTPATQSSASTSTWQNTPQSFASPSPSTPASSSAVRPALVHSISGRKAHHSPVRTSHRVEVATLNHPPQSSFNPSLPQLQPAGVPFVTTPSIPVGSKRQIVDVEMADESGHAARSTPSRASKRRSLGGHLGKGDDTTDGDKDRDRRRGRRGHGGHGGHGGHSGHGGGAAGSAMA